MLAALTASSSARADVSSWLFVGAGPTWLSDQRPDTVTRFTLDLSIGMGTPPSDALIFGGMLDSSTHFSEGTDLALSLRSATHGFANGEWGLAVDLGAYQRWWGAGSTGFRGALVLGAPWGLTLSGVAALGSNDARTYSAVLGVDLARLTVYRRSGSSWWKNPFPAYRPEDER